MFKQKNVMQDTKHRCVTDVKTSLDGDGDGSITKVSHIWKAVCSDSHIYINTQFFQAWLTPQYFKDEFVANAVKSKFIYNMFIAE